ncbi:hypothetical protein BDD12DRAFT_888277 [Trichophaea hybrida]|nr:hypothetical protein BDD12DRAFT_888277 [Trichophaea hybrida]
MGNRAKKVKKGLVRAHKPAVAKTPVKVAPAQAAASAPKIRVPSLNAEVLATGKAPPPPRPRHRQSRLTMVLPTRKPSQSLRTYIESLPQDVKKDVVEHYWTTRRLICGSLPEIAVPFPDDAHLSETEVEDYKKLVQLQAKNYAEQLQIHEEHMWAPLGVMVADRLAWENDFINHAQAQCAEIYFDNLKHNEAEKLEEQKEEVAAKSRQNEHNLTVVGGHFQHERYVGSNAACIGRRFPWRNGKTMGMVYYNFLKSELGTLVTHTLQMMCDIGPGNIPLAYGVAGEIAMDSAMCHRMYSEALGLLHSPQNPIVRQRLGISCWTDIVTRSVALNLGWHFYSRSACLKKTLDKMVELRSEHGIYHPSQSGDFHNGGNPLWISCINGALNVYANIEVHEQFALKSRMAAGHDNTSWYAYDVRELGLMMNALRAYNEPVINLRTGPDQEHTPDNESADAQLEGTYDSVYINTSQYSSTHIPQDTKSGLFINEPRALQAIAFHMEILRLARGLHDTIRVSEKREAFLTPRSPDGRQAPRIQLDIKRRVRLRKKGDPKAIWREGVPTIALGRFLYEETPHDCC